jgi:hypothetical protein
MKCQKCVEAGLRSRVDAPGYGVVTAMACPRFYDEDGAYHDHDSNSRSELWRCSNGHCWTRICVNRCPAPGCAWNEGRHDRVIWS